MKEDLEKLVKQAYELDAPFDADSDDAERQFVIDLLGERYKISILKEVIKHYEEKLKDIENVQIPDMLLEIGMLSVTTDDGLKVSLKTEYNVSVLDPDYLSDWMDSNGGGHLWKNSLKFEKGQDIAPVIETAEELGLDYKEAMEIHPQTLKKFVKDFIEGGASAQEIPEGAARVSTFIHAKVQRS